MGKKIKTKFQISEKGFTLPQFFKDNKRDRDNLNWGDYLSDNSCFKKTEAGFSLIELMVVLAIMGFLFGFFLVNINALRGKRNLKLAQSQLVSNLRKIQSYTLSSRNIFGSIPAQYYIMKFNMAAANQYALYAVYDIPVSAGKVKNLEILTFPQGVRISSVDIDLPGVFVDQINATCALAGFKAPFAKILTNGDSACNPASPGDPYDIVSGDDFNKITAFHGNGGTAASDAIMTITLREDQTNSTKWIKVNGINGIIDFEQ